MKMKIAAAIVAVTILAGFTSVPAFANVVFEAASPPSASAETGSSEISIRMLSRIASFLLMFLILSGAARRPRS